MFLLGIFVVSIIFSVQPFLKKNIMKEFTIDEYTLFTSIIGLIMFLVGSLFKGLELKDLKYGQNKRSSEHIGMYGDKPFDEKLFKKYLNHEKIENLTGLEVELIYEWEVGSMLIFDRTNLHCSSSVIDGKKIGLTTFTKK